MEREALIPGSIYQWVRSDSRPIPVLKYYFVGFTPKEKLIFTHINDDSGERVIIRDLHAFADQDFLNHLKLWREPRRYSGWHNLFPVGEKIELSPRGFATEEEARRVGNAYNAIAQIFIAWEEPQPE